MLHSHALIKGLSKGKMYSVDATMPCFLGYVILFREALEKK